jgi:hypothetical protein
MAPRLFVSVDDGAYQAIEAVRRWWLDAKRLVPLACRRQQSVWTCLGKVEGCLLTP